MLNKSRKIKWGEVRNLIYVLSILILSKSAIAGPLGLPDSARPGAVRPQAEAVPEEVDEIQAEDMVDIPAVIDRPFDLDEGPYVAVKEFRLLDAEDLPKFDIKVEEIKTSILDKFINEQTEEGFSIGQLQEVADEVTRYYRARGLILSTAVVPVQTVTTGVVDIQIFIGRLGRVIAESNEKYSEQVLRKPFLDLIGEPVTKEKIEAALLTLTDFPGLTVFGVFQPGRKVGEADMILKVQQEKWYGVSYRADNHGIQETGRNRFRTTIDWNNPLGKTALGSADKVTATYQQTYNPKNSDFWSLEYQRYLGRGYSFGISSYKNRFDVGGNLAANDVQSEQTQRSLYVNKSFKRGRTLNLFSKIAMTQKISRTTVQAAQTSIDRLAVLDLELNLDSVDTFHPLLPLVRLIDKKLPDNFGGGINFLTIAHSRGFNDILGAMGSSGDQLNSPFSSRSSRFGNQIFEQAEGQFDKLTVNFQRLQVITEAQSFLLKLDFQWSNDILPTVEQYAVGGPENVRGFPDGDGLFDRAWFFSLQYNFNAPFIKDVPAFYNRTWGELLQYSVFYDFAVGQQNDGVNSSREIATSGKWVNYKSVGMGLRFQLPGTLDSRLMWATELGPQTPDDGRHSHIWGDITYSF